MYIKHLDLCQIYKVHSTKDNGNYAETRETAASLSQEHWPTAWAGQVLLLIVRMWGQGTRREGLGAEEQVFTEQEVFQLLDKCADKGTEPKENIFL